MQISQVLAVPGRRVRQARRRLKNKGRSGATVLHQHRGFQWS
jgi:hypothetical protein